MPAGDTPGASPRAAPYAVSPEPARSKEALFQTPATAARLGEEINRTEQVLAAGKDELRLFSEALGGLSQFAKMTSERQSQIMHRMALLEGTVGVNSQGAARGSGGVVNGISNGDAATKATPEATEGMAMVAATRGLLVNESKAKLLAQRAQQVSEAEVTRLREATEGMAMVAATRGLLVNESKAKRLAQRAQQVSEAEVARLREATEGMAMVAATRGLLVDESKAKHLAQRAQQVSEAEVARLREELQQAQTNAQQATQKADQVEGDARSVYARLYEQWSSDRERMKAMYEQWTNDRLRLQQFANAHKVQHERAKALYDNWSAQKDTTEALYNEMSSMKGQLAETEQKAAKSQEQAAQARMAQQLAEEEAMALWKMQGQMLDAQDSRASDGTGREPQRGAWAA